MLLLHAKNDRVEYVLSEIIIKAGVASIGFYI